MQYKQFKALVLANCPDVKCVSKHGDFCNNPSKNTLGVMFKNSNRVYDYSGTYFQILNQLGYKCTTQEDIDITEGALKALERNHGAKGLFGKVIDNSSTIAILKKELAELQALPIVPK